MNRSFALLSLTILGLGCESENTVKRINDNDGGVPTYGDVSGRVCDPTGFTWLEGASVYANLADPETGYINEAGKCLVMQVWLNNKPTIIVLLDSWGKMTRIGDANRIKRWMETTQASSGKKARTV